MWATVVPRVTPTMAPARSGEMPISGAIDLALTDEPGKTTSAAIIGQVGVAHPMLAVDYVLAHKAQYEALIDVSAREQGRRTWPATPLTSWLGKSFDTFAPIGPCIATADEVKDPNDLVIRFWNDGQLRHNYNTDDMEHRVPELVEWATTVMTLNSGDLIACGTNHEGLGFLQDGESVDIEIVGIGKMSLKVRDPLKRTWERGVYMGVDSTNPDAVKRHRPQGGPTATGAI